jgi:hypothetical protein
VHHRAGVSKLRHFKSCLRFQISFSALSSNPSSDFKEKQRIRADLRSNNTSNMKIRAKRNGFTSCLSMFLAFSLNSVSNSILLLLESANHFCSNLICCCTLKLEFLLLLSTPIQFAVYTYEHYYKNELI